MCYTKIKPNISKSSTCPISSNNYIGGVIYFDYDFIALENMFKQISELCIIVN